MTFQGYIETDSITVGTASGAVYIGGLPTAALNVGYIEASATIGESASFGGDVPSAATIVYNTQTIALNYRSTSNGNTVALDVTDLNTGAGNKVKISGSYIAA